VRLDPDFAALVHLPLGCEPGVRLGSEDADQVFVTTPNQGIGQKDGLAFEWWRDGVVGGASASLETSA